MTETSEEVGVIVARLEREADTVLVDVGVSCVPELEVLGLPVLLSVPVATPVAEALVVAVAAWDVDEEGAAVSEFVARDDAVPVSVTLILSVGKPVS